MADAQDLLNFGSNQVGGGLTPQSLLASANAGQQALADGIVPLKAAKAMQKKLGLDTPEGAQDALSKILGHDQQQSPYVFGPQNTPPPGTMPPPAQAPTPKKGVQTKDAKTSEDSSGSKQIKNTFAGAEEANNQFDVVRNTPEFQAQQQGLLDMQDQRDKMAATKNPNDNWVKPLLAFGDSLNGTHQADYFQPGQEKKDAAMQKFNNEIQQRRGDMSKLLVDSFGKLKTGSDQTQQNQKAGTNVYVGTGMPGGLSGGLNQRTLATQATAAGQQYDKEPMLKALEGSFNNFDKFQSLIDGKAPITSSVFNNLQEELTRATRGAQSGGAVADGAVIRDQMNPLAAAWNKIETNLVRQGKVPDMRTDAPAIFEQLQQLKNQLRQDFENQYQQRVEQLRHNFDASSDLLGAPEIKKASYDKADALEKARITGGKGLPIAPIPGAPSAAPKRTKELKDMTKAELDAYEQSLHQ